MDFTSQLMRQAEADLKMQLIFATPGQPRGRGRIERFFRTVNEMFLCDLDGYLHRSRRKPTLTLESLETQFRRFLLEVYHRRPNQEGDETPIQPWERGEFLPQMPDSLERLDLLLMYAVRPRTVRRDGIHFAICPPSSPLTSGKRSPCASTHETWARSASSSATASCVLARDRAGAQRTAARAEQILRDRREAVDSLLELRRGLVEKTTHDKQPAAIKPQQPRLKRYWNERLSE